MPRRYFEEQDSSKVGVVSDELRNALRLGRDKCPLWIYRMRVLGYPPGYLKRARVSHSTFTVFEGYERTNNTDKDEGKETYNPDMFVEFPGFNVPLPNSVYDDCEYLGMPPMLPHQQLKFAKKTVVTPKQTPYKRIGLSPLSTSNLTQQKSSESENLSDSGNAAKTSTKSNTEEKNEVPNGTTVNLGTAEDAIVIESSSDEEVTEETSAEEVTSLPQDVKQDVKETQEAQQLKLISMGSPVPLSTKKPPLENFAVGMDSLIYFENLPTSTGVFDKMRTVINKIREKRSQ